MTAAVLAGRAWPQVGLWRGVLVLLCCSAALASSQSWAGGAEKERTVAPEWLDGDMSLRCLTIWWVTCLGSWLRAGVVWFTPDVLRCFWKEKQERKWLLECETGAVASGDVSHNLWRL